MKNLIILMSNFDDSKIWGGNKLRDFGYTGPSDRIGEAYLISALKNKPSYINEEWVEEKNLYDFFNNNREWFGNYDGEYPLLSKIIDAKDDLSVQVHPDDKYAKEKFNKLGKTEAWYILDCAPNADIVYGLKTKEKKDVEDAIKENKWSSILNFMNIKKGDVLYIPSGTVHAIKKDTLIFEIQQSSDITFRLYDYDRVDENNNKRELHIEDSLNVIDFNHECKIGEVENNIMVQSKFFNTNIYDINDWRIFYFNDVYWIEVVVLDGDSADINGRKIKKGVSAILKNNTPFKIKGNVKVAITYIKKENNNEV